MSQPHPTSEILMRRALPALLIALGFAMNASAQPRPGTGPAYEQDNFGKMPPTKDKAGKDVPGPIVTRFTLVNKNGVTVKCIEYGAIITEILVPGKDGKF